MLLTRIFLGEKIPTMWPLQMVLCVTGALLVNKPLAPPPGCTAAITLIPVAAAFFGALMNFVSRNVKDVPPPVVTAFNDVVAVTFASGYIVLQNSNEDLETAFLPDGFDSNFGILLASAIIGWLGLMSNVKGYQSVSVAAVASIASYISVPFGYAAQIFVFREIPDILSIAGASLILGTNVTVAISKYFAAKEVAKDQGKEIHKPLIGVDVTQPQD
jgi:drug/metabolite transporter (DMT)-like permease